MISVWVRSVFSRQAISWMFSSVLSLSVLALANASQAYVVSNYDYPYANNPYLATTTTRLLKVRHLKPQTLDLPVLAGRSHVALAPALNSLQIAYYAQSKPAPLIFMLPGTGGDATDGDALFLAEMFYEWGFSAVVLPSPFSWQFVLTESTQAVPGYTPADAQDLYRVAQQAADALQRQGRAQITGYSVIGYSLGGLDAGFFEQIDKQQHAFHFSRVVMIDPPADILHAIRSIDGMRAVADSWTPQQRDLAWGEVWNKGPALIARDINDPSYFLGLDKSVFAKTNVVQYLIGDSFRQSLADVIMVSQQIHDLGLLKRPATPMNRSLREAEAENISFTQYEQQAVYPFWSAQMKQPMSNAEFVKRGDLSLIKGQLSHDPAVFLLQNEDDVLGRKSDILALDQAFAGHSIVYPAGGHVGNLWFQRNRDDLKQILVYGSTTAVAKPQTVAQAHNSAGMAVPVRRPSGRTPLRTPVRRVSASVRGQLNHRPGATTHTQPQAQAPVAPL